MTIKHYSILTLLLGCSGIASATTSFCTTASLSTYLDPTFACTIGDKTFTDFSAVLTSVLGATPATFDDITVNPSGDSEDPTFAFSADFSAGGIVQSETFTVGYAGFAPVSDPFVGTTFSLNGANVTDLTALITGAEALCENDTFVPLGPTLSVPLVCSSGVGVNVALDSDITDANLDALVPFNFAPVTTLGVVKQITLTGALEATASATGLENAMDAESTTPEPGGMVLCGIGIAVLAWKNRGWSKQRPRHSA